jgi:hypothetical protein
MVITLPVALAEIYSTKMAYDVAPMAAGAIVILVAVVVMVEFHAGAPPNMEMGPLTIAVPLPPVQSYMRVLILSPIRCAVTFTENGVKSLNTILKDAVPE